MFIPRPPRGYQQSFQVDGVIIDFLNLFIFWILITAAIAGVVEIMISPVTLPLKGLRTLRNKLKGKE